MAVPLALKKYAVINPGLTKSMKIDDQKLIDIN